MAIIGYECLCWRGAGLERNNFPLNIAARIIARNAPSSYELIEEMLLKGPDTTTGAYASKIQIPNVWRSRYGFDVQIVILKLAIPADKWWPDKSPEVSFWAERKLETLETYFSDDKMLRDEVMFLLGDLREAKNG